MSGLYAVAPASACWRQLLVPRSGTRPLLGETVREANSAGDLKSRAEVSEEKPPGGVSGGLARIVR